MDTDRLMRLGGLTAILAGGASALFNLATVAGLFPQSLEAPRILITVTLTIFALMAVYSRQSGQAGVLGLAGFVLLEINLLLSFASRYLDTFVAPVLTGQFPAAAAAIGGQAAFNYVVMLMFLLYLLGYVLFGAATLRAGVLPRGAAWLFIAGAVINFAGNMTMFLPAGYAGAILAHTAMALFGYSLWAAAGGRASRLLPALGQD